MVRLPAAVLVATASTVAADLDEGLAHRQRRLGEVDVDVDPAQPEQLPARIPRRPASHHSANRSSSVTVVRNCAR